MQVKELVNLVLDGEIYNSGGRQKEEGKLGNDT